MDDNGSSFHQPISVFARLNLYMTSAKEPPTLTCDKSIFANRELIAELFPRTLIFTGGILGKSNQAIIRRLQYNNLMQDNLQMDIYTQSTFSSKVRRRTMGLKARRGDSHLGLDPCWLLPGFIKLVPFCAPCKLKEHCISIFQPSPPRRRRK